MLGAYPKKIFFLSTLLKIYHLARSNSLWCLLTLLPHPPSPSNYSHIFASLPILRYQFSK